MFCCDAKHSDILWRSLLLARLEIFCLNISIYIITKQQLCGEGFPSLLPLHQAEAVNHLFPTNKPKKLASGLVLQESTNILQLKLYTVSVMKKKLGTHLGRNVLLIWLHSFPICLECTISGSSVFSFLSMTFHIIK